MASTFHVFIIEDHPLIAEAYTCALERIFEQDDKNLKISISTNIDCVLEKLKDEKFFNSVNLIILDIHLPISKSTYILSGEDLGLRIKKINSSIKIMVSTSLDDNHRIYCILKSLNPEGFLVKNDVDRKELLIAIDKIISEPPSTFKKNC